MERMKQTIEDCDKAILAKMEAMLTDHKKSYELAMSNLEKIGKRNAGYTEARL